ncbi:flagellar rod assembly protein/muramidase FlgJ [Pseudogulbenkiania sp. NH8B]|uniref:flagellar assembly peptidoglycan hydrolase FlgJ n=1 Tax=Pseudogulbenkiania sp. (strain NH8B) TaxID=748280 RepID=UPI0002279AAC|nr:flagellar assembly peptidoglycan hydrolase FlgJ [Pseudogulbenkiania sp. NH8B]BAK76358.1 flagellar rod assembly protein/muramidase FlgJ [Pseudogulbenkiania sp. NH8B]
MSVSFPTLPNDASTASQRLAVDPGQTAALQVAARKDPQAAIKAAAQQFESLFMGTLLKTMRETSFDGEEDSNAMGTYRGMLDQQLLQTMSKSGGVGLADVLSRQLAHAAQLDNDASPTVERLAPASSMLPMVNQAIRAYQTIQSKAAAGLTNPASEAPSPTTGAVGGTAESFVTSLLPHARDAAQQLGVAPELVLAHAALESGWGKRSIKTADGKESHNLFGIKAGANWQGDSVDVLTTEYVNGNAVKKIDKFRAYASYSEAFADYAKLLSGSSRYQSALNQGGDMLAFARGLQSGGYATDPHYAQKLVGVMGAVSQRSRGA